MMLMMLDARYAMLDGDRLADAEILIIDLQKYNFCHFFIQKQKVRELVSFILIYSSSGSNRFKIQ